MMENRCYLNNLFDIYKDLLTDIEQLTFVNYYMEDLSLSEIALNRGISKSSAGKTLKQVEDKLKEYEDKLKIYSFKEELIKIMEENSIDEIKKRVTSILNLI